eukprot:PhF_6_TR8771/c1_g2_i1/m.13880
MGLLRTFFRRTENCKFCLEGCISSHWRAFRFAHFFLRVRWPVRRYAPGGSLNRRDFGTAGSNNVHCRSVGAKQANHLCKFRGIQALTRQRFVGLGGCGWVEFVFRC